MPLVKPTCANRTTLVSPRMGHVFHRNPLHDYPVAVAGDGCYLYGRDGKR